MRAGALLRWIMNVPQVSLRITVKDGDHIEYLAFQLEGELVKFGTEYLPLAKELPGLRIRVIHELGKAPKERELVKQGARRIDYVDHRLPLPIKVDLIGVG